MVASPRSSRVPRRGFTLIEMVVTSFLMSLLSLILILAWRTFGVPALEVEARARITLQANLAAESLARDLGGYQRRQEGNVERLYKFDSRVDDDGGHPYPLALRLRFKREDQRSNPIALTVSYYVNSVTNTLVRIEEESGATTTVANHVMGLSFTQFNELIIVVSYQRYQGTYTLNVSYPQ